MLQLLQKTQRTMGFEKNAFTDVLRTRQPSSERQTGCPERSLGRLAPARSGASLPAASATASRASSPCSRASGRCPKAHSTSCSHSCGRSSWGSGCKSVFRGNSRSRASTPEWQRYNIHYFGHPGTTGETTPPPSPAHTWPKEKGRRPTVSTVDDNLMIRLGTVSAGSKKQALSDAWLPQKPTERPRSWAPWRRPSKASSS
mmetsp:Transcript_81104/g.229725  ORF Transcript_81104/g.229725 Transcript_81104/m.229725 type:complete len:201 (+) Transcript_81104:95-697(+)